jgi:hypothetical protein
MEKVSITLSGDGVVEQASQLLESIDVDDHAKRIEIQITESKQEEHSNGDIESQTGDSCQSDDGNTRQPDEEDRYRGDIQANTAPHHALNALKERTSDGSVTTASEITNMVDSYGTTTVRPALTELHKRMLAERETAEGGNYYQYRITEYGREILEEYGKPK